MSTYKNTSASNRDTFSTVGVDGKLSGKVGVIVAGETFQAVDKGSYLQLAASASKAKTGQYVYESGMTLQATPPPATNPSMPVELRGFDALGNPIPGAVWKLQQ